MLKLIPHHTYARAVNWQVEHVLEATRRGKHMEGVDRRKKHRMHQVPPTDSPADAPTDGPT